MLIYINGLKMTISGKTDDLLSVLKVAQKELGAHSDWTRDRQVLVDELVDFIEEWEKEKE